MSHSLQTPLTMPLAFADGNYGKDVVERFQNGALPGRLYLERMCVAASLPL